MDASPHAGGRRGTVGDTCPFCGLSYSGSPNQCPRCGTLLGEAAHDLRRLGASERDLLRTRRARADLFFLLGLLLGGPMISLGGEMELGLFIVLAGGFASVLRRYSSWSSVGTVVVGGCGAAVVAALLLDVTVPAVESWDAGEEARMAYVSALARADRDVLIEARGPGAVTVWFTVPGGGTGDCGSYPDESVRRHLADLGFVRVIVAARNRSGGPCSFRP